MRVRPCRQPPRGRERADARTSGRLGFTHGHLQPQRPPRDAAQSSYRAHVGLAQPPEWLGSVELHGYLLGRDLESSADRARAAQAYAEFVAAGRDAKLWADGLNRQIYLGDDDFVQRMQGAAAPSPKRSPAVPKAQRSSPRTLEQWLAHCATREQALRQAHAASGFTMAALAAELGLTPARVGQLIARAERRGQSDDSA